MASTFHYLLTHPAKQDRQTNQPRALIMAPTRELAVQIHSDAEALSQSTGLKLGLAYGGDGYDKQLKVLESGVDILIGTTGRLIDYTKQNYVDLGAMQVVVLDEADRMYDPALSKTSVIVPPHACGRSTPEHAVLRHPVLSRTRAGLRADEQRRIC